MSLANPWNAISKPYDEEGCIVFRVKGATTYGTTAFSRHASFTKKLIANFKAASSAAAPQVLYGPSSVGCDAASLVMDGFEDDLFKKYPDLVIDALDIQPEYLEVARSGIYPSVFFERMPKSRREKYFTPVDVGDDSDEYFQLTNEVRERINVLPAGDLTKFDPGKKYDIALCFHLLEYFEENRGPKIKILRSLFTLADLTCVNYQNDLDPMTMRAAIKPFGQQFFFGPTDETFQAIAIVSNDSPVKDFEIFSKNHLGKIGAFTFIRKCRPGDPGIPGPRS